MRLTKKREDNGRYYLSGLTEVSNRYPKGYGRIQVGHAVEKLAEYEDLEEQGKLLKLPAAMGDEIFFIFMDCPKDYKEEYCRDHEGSCENCHHRVPEIVSKDFQMSDIPNMDKIFATREEAEAALKELEGAK